MGAVSVGILIWVFLMQGISSIVHIELDLPLLYWGTVCPLDKYDSLFLCAHEWIQIHGISRCECSGFMH